MMTSFKNSKIYRIFQKIYLFFLIPFRKTFVYKMFMNDLPTESFRKSKTAKLMGKFTQFFGWISHLITQSFTYRTLKKWFSKTTVSEIVGSSKILGWRRVDSSGYSFSFLIFLMVLFLAGILPTMAVVALCILALIFAVLESNCQNNLKQAKPILTDLLIGFYLIALLYGLWISKSPDKLQIFLVYFVFVGLYYVVRYFVSSPRRLIMSISYFTLSGILVCAFGYLQYITGSYETTTWTDTKLFTDIEGRIYSTFQNPNVFGEYLLFLIPLALAMCIIAKEKLHKFVYGICVVAALGCLILTYSRGCWLGLIAGMALFIILLYRKALIPIILASPFALLMLPQNILNRFMSIGNLKDNSTAYRVYIWRGSVDMLGKHWPTGVGLGSYSFEASYAPFAYNAIMAPHSHSLYFHQMSETGIFGFLILILLAFFTLKQLFMVYKRPKSKELGVLAVALISGFVSFLIQSFFDNTFYNYRIYMFFFAFLSLAASLYAVGEEEAK